MLFDFSIRLRADKEQKQKKVKPSSVEGFTLFIKKIQRPASKTTGALTVSSIKQLARGKLLLNPIVHPQDSQTTRITDDAA